MNFHQSCIVIFLCIFLNFQNTRSQSDEPTTKIPTIIFGDSENTEAIPSSANITTTTTEKITTTTTTAAAESTTKNVTNPIKVDRKGFRRLLKEVLLHDYDVRVRPDLFADPLRVGVTILVKSLSSVNEVDMEYQMDFYLRQKWVDPRLVFEFGHIDVLNLSSDFIKEIWIPDTVFQNEKKSYVHSATVPNKFVRVYKNGTVITTTRLALTATCPMNLQLYPFDNQICGTELESFGYDNENIQYYWDGGDKAVQMALNSATLPQFIVYGHRQSEKMYTGFTGTYSTLRLDFLFVRSFNHYMTQIYLPSILIVVIAYVPLWMGRDNTAPRLAIGVTAVLTMTTIYMASAAKSPPINYVKALDIYLAICFLGVFSTLVESAFVGYLVKRAKMRKEKRDKAKKENQEKNNSQAQVELEIKEKKDKLRMKQFNFYVSMVDVTCRVLFPICFGLFNVIYWAYFLSASQVNVDDKACFLTPRN